MELTGVLFFPVTPFGPLRGLDAGAVRAPLTPPSSRHLAEFEALTARGLSLVRP